MGDPSSVLRLYRNAKDTECAAFLMAMLSFGNRAQFLKKARSLLDAAGGYPSQWLESGEWQNFPSGDDKFYRFYSYNDIKKVLFRLQDILRESGSLEQAIRQKTTDKTDPARAISSLFPDCKPISRGKTSAHKRLWMFLRWMVRRNSPVDLGLWTWYSPRDLIIPLDTHVLQSAKMLDLVGKNAAADNKTAHALTDTLRQVWPDDPCKGDFALFGLGIEPTP